MEKIGVDFKTLIAYLVPGLIFLYSTSLHLPRVHELLGGDKASPEGPAVVLILILSIGAGIFINAFTWAIVRPFIELTSESRPELDYSKVSKDNLAAFRVVIDENFRYYQAYANTFSACAIYFCSWIAASRDVELKFLISLLVIHLVLFFAARDSLKRTYGNMKSLLKMEAEMTNGVPAPRPKKDTLKKDAAQKNQIPDTEPQPISNHKKKEENS